jgi:hypothetical protein
MIPVKILSDSDRSTSREESIFIRPETNIVTGMSKTYKANFDVIVDEDGVYCAADKEQMIFTDGKSKQELEKRIRDAVECYFEVPHTRVDIRIHYN